MIALSLLFLGHSTWGQTDIYSYLPENFDDLPYDSQYEMLDSIRRDGADRPYEINVGLSLLGMSLAEDAKDPSGVALWASTVARLYGNTGLYTEAFNYGLVSLENARKANSL